MSAERGIFLRGDTYWISYGHRGKQYRESAETTSITKARKLRVSRLADLKAGKRPDQDRITLEHLGELVTGDYEARRLRSLERVKRSLKVILDALGRETRAVDVTGARLTQYLVDRRTEGMADASILQELAALRRGYSLAMKGKELSERPTFPAVRLDNARQGFFNDADVASLLPHLPAYAQPLVQFLYLTGWRVGEARGLTWDRCDFPGGMVRLEGKHTKNKTGRAFPFSALPKLAELLTEQRARTSALIAATGEDIPHVFHRHGAAIRDFRYVWQRACAAAGMEGRLVHDLRRSAVRNLERAGVPRSIATKLTGHLTEAVYLRYAIATEDDLRAGVEKLAKLNSTITAQTEA